MKRFQSSTSDIISTLDSDITENILQRLPLRDAVRTTVLSRGWRYKWETLPALVFDECCPRSLANRDLKTIVYQVLLLHNGPLVKFYLDVPRFISCVDINHWILILLKKNIQEFTLFLRPGQNHKLISHLFSFLQLRHLSLSHCLFEPPPTFRGFSKLVELVLKAVDVVPERLENFISNCPRLERLTLNYCTRSDELEINAPNLKYFEFYGSFKSLHFRSTPLLAEVLVYLSCTRRELREDSSPVTFFQSLPAIQKLSLKELMLKFLAVGSLPKKLPITLNHLVTLSLHIYFNEINEVSFAICLIRSSPNLRKLKMVGLASRVNTEAVTDFLKAQDLSNCPLNKLLKVKIFEFAGAEPEMLFVKLLLAWSTALEKLEISFPERNPPAKANKLLKKLMQLPRASPKAELIVFSFPSGFDMGGHY